eukprot:scaffold10120_cov17-Tisochrysis_lutea.AAC.2
MPCSLAYSSTSPEDPEHALLPRLFQLGSVIGYQAQPSGAGCACGLAPSLVPARDCDRLPGTTITCRLRGSVEVINPDRPGRLWMVEGREDVKEGLWRVLQANNNKALAAQQWLESNLIG